MQKTLAVIDLSAVRHNAKLVRQAIGGRFFFAVVKADAYGHGAEEVAREIEDVADGFCVAIAEEGVALRVAGISKPILVLAPPLDKSDAEEMKFYGLSATVCNEQSARLSYGLPCHIAVNTGMNRYGCPPDGVEKLLSLLDPESVAGVYSHMYAPERADISGRQLALFKGAAERVKAFSHGALVHFAASGGILRGGEYLCEGVRCGLMLYGYAPAHFKNAGLRPAMKVYARRAQTTRAVGGGVGYNIADRAYRTLHTYRLGYADGFARGVPLGEKTLCMDAFISLRGEELLPVFTDADAYARECGTISYEALCSVTRRSLRVYERGTEI